jgi:hypothetical protein
MNKPRTKSSDLRPIMKKVRYKNTIAEAVLTMFTVIHTTLYSDAEFTKFLNTFTWFVPLKECIVAITV